MADAAEEIGISKQCRALDSSRCQEHVRVIRGQLAVYSKLEHDLNDYRLLRQSEPAWPSRELGQKLFAANIRVDASDPRSKRDLRKVRYLTGSITPPGSTELHLFVLSRAWTPFGDHASRFVEAFCALLVPYAEAARTNLGFSELIAGLPWWEEMDPRERKPLKPIEIHPDKDLLAQRIHDVDRIGFEQCATLAALALEQPIGLIADRQGMPEEQLERARYLDAVMSLLPYGCRAGIPLSTWNETPDKDVVEQIGFFPIAGVKRLGIDPHVPGSTVTPQSNEAIAYLSNLRALNNEAGPPSKLIPLLTMFTSPATTVSTDIPAKAIQALLRPRRALKAVRAQRANASAVAAIFEDGLDDLLSRPEEGELLEYLIQAAGNERELKPVRSRWQPALESMVLAMIEYLAHTPGRQESAAFDRLIGLALDQQFAPSAVERALRLAPERNRKEATDQPLDLMLRSPRFVARELQREVVFQLQSKPDRLRTLIIQLGNAAADDQHIAASWLLNLTHERTKGIAVMANTAAAAAGIIGEDLPPETFVEILNQRGVSIVPFLNISLRRKDWTPTFTHLLPALCFQIALERDSNRFKRERWHKALLEQVSSRQLMGSPGFQARWDLFRVLMDETPIFVPLVNRTARTVFSAELHRQVHFIVQRASDSKTLNPSWKKLLHSYAGILRRDGFLESESMNLIGYLRGLNP